MDPIGWRPLSVQVMLMSQVVTAVFENGIIRPVQSVNLPERSRVEITIRPAGDPPSAHVAALADLDQACAEIVIPPEATRMTREEMYRSRSK